MEQRAMIPDLIGVIEELRANRSSCRIVVHNVRQFGLIHLYFVDGALREVESRHGSAATALSEVAGWTLMTIRVDERVYPPVLDSDAAMLDSLLDAVLMRADSPNEPLSGAHGDSARPSSPSSGFSASWPSPSFASATWQLPPLAGTGARAGASASRSTAGVEQGISRAQWQVVTLLVHEISVGLGRAIGNQMSILLLQQALHHAARSHSVLFDLELDSDGWLHSVPEADISVHRPAELADAVAAVLAGYEKRCACLLTPAEAHGLVRNAAEPFRSSLSRLGLGIAD